MADSSEPPRGSERDVPRTPFGRGRRCARAAGVAAWIGALAVLASVLWDDTLVASVRGDEELVPEAESALAASRVGLRVLAIAAFGLTALLFVIDRPRSRKGLAATLFGLVLAGAVALAELLAAPLAPPLTDLFEPHPTRGWALVPGARDEWMGVPIAINVQGMRGPVRAIPKPAGVRRVLFLGDSVVFGFQLEDDADTVPARVEALLDARVDASVESLNAAVGGYSPWQEALLLREEGLAFEPDAVVVGFVLNDVAEKLSLEHFGGAGRGFQLEHSRAVHGLAWRSSVVRWLLSERAEARGADEAFAREEVGPSLRELLADSDAPAVRAAWDLTLPRLVSIVDDCRARGIAVLIAVFPYSIQLEAPGLDAPQRRLAAFARERDVALLDLRPAFRAALAESGGDPDALFLDLLHLTPRGSEVAARAIAERLVELEALADRDPTGGAR